MTVILTSPVEGQLVGEEYSGPNEAWLLQEGYAKRPTAKSEPSFLSKPKHIEYEHEEADSAPEEHAPLPLVQNGPSPVAPDTAVQTGHAADPTAEKEPEEVADAKDEVEGDPKPEENPSA